MELTALTALSPLDGRYGSKTAALRDFFSEYALIKYRVIVEIEWLKALAAEPAITEVPAFSSDAVALLDGIADGFSVADAERVKTIEATTNHDVKAVYSATRIRGFLHLYIGEEAVATGVMQALGPDDAVVATYREHGHALARGLPSEVLMAEMF